MIYWILFSLLCNQFSLAANFDPALKWYTIETDHFSIHFPSKSKELEQNEFANQVALVCENVHQKLVPFMRHKPKQKTNVIIGDVYDYVSGWALPLPNNTIFICPTFPKDMTVNYKDWLENLIIHEYTHILHMDMAAGFSGFLRKIFGQIILPNAIMPTMFHEAFTIFNETEIGKMGRCSSSYYNMMLRTVMLENKFFSIDKCVTYELSQFPSGETPYLYGGMFYQFLSEKYSSSKLVDYSHWYSGGLPLFYNVQAKRIFKKSIGQLWKEWKRESAIKYQTQIDKVKEKLITKTEQLTFEGYYTNAPVFSNDGKRIYFVSKNNHAYPAVKYYDMDSKKVRPLIKKNISSAITITYDDSKLLFSVRDWYNNYYDYDDIYSFDLSNRKLRRITNGLRATDPDFSPIDNQIIFVGNALGQTNLFLADSDGKNIRQITFSDDFTQYSQPRFSPDGKKIVVAKWSVGGEQDLYLYDLQSEWWTPITHTSAIDIQPCWTKDGNYIFYSSDITGVFNIYAYCVKDDKTYQVTNVLTGAFTPTVSPDNKQLAFVQYSSKGFDVHITEINIDSIVSQDFVIASENEAILNKEENNLTETISANLYHYNPFPSILPKFWLPWFMYDNQDKWSLGAMTYGADALFFNQYLIQAYYNLTSRKPTIYADWTIDKYRPTININGYYDQGKFGCDIVNTFSFIKNDFVQYFSQSYSINKTDYLLSGFGLSYQFGNAKTYAYSISPEQGTGISLSAAHYNKLIGSDYNLTKIYLGVNQYLNLLFKHHILMLGLRTGLAFGDAEIRDQYALNIRGKTTGYDVSKIIKATCEYRFPIFWIERGLGLFPLFFKNVSGTLFFDYARPLSADRHPQTAIMSVGAELHLNTIVFYEIPMTFTGGIASDLNDFYHPQIYIQFSPQIPFMEARRIKIEAFNI